MDGSAKTSRTGTPPGFPDNFCRLSAGRRVRCSTANGQAVRTADDTFPPESRDADGWETRRVDPGPKAKRGSGRRDPRTPSCRAGSRSAGQRLIPSAVSMRMDCQNGCNPFVPVWAAHKRGSGKAQAYRRSDRDGRADRASETVGGGGLATRKIRRRWSSGRGWRGAKAAGCAATFSVHGCSARRRGGWRWARGGS